MNLHVSAAYQFLSALITRETASANEIVFHDPAGQPYAALSKAGLFLSCAATKKGNWFTHISEIDCQKLGIAGLNFAERSELGKDLARNLL